jgi:hypothetical protein
VLNVFSRPAIIIILAFVLEVGEKINLFWNQNQDQGVGCGGKEKEEQNHYMQPPEVPKKLLSSNWFIPT